MNKKLQIRWSRGAGKAMRAKLRQADVRVSSQAGPVQARLELVVEVGGRVVRVPVPADYVLLSPADWTAVAGNAGILD